MDVLQLIVTSVAVFIVLLLMVYYFACQLGPKANAWLRSTREEKTGLSHKKLYNANGFLIPSGSDFLLSSTGSFKRFDSVDRECKQQDQPSTSPLWNLPANSIPGQPLRPAPSPPPSATTPRFFATHALEPELRHNPQQQQHQHHHPIKQQSWAGRSSSPSPTIVSTSTSAIPRPTAKRQFSTPTSIGKLPEGCLSPPSKRVSVPLTKERSTNPFLDPEKSPDLPVTEVLVTQKSPFLDLVGDSLVECSRLQSSDSSSSKPLSDQEEVLGFSFSADVPVLPDQVIVQPFSVSEPLIFNFENVSVGVVTGASGKTATGGIGSEMYSRVTGSGAGDLISLDVKEGNFSVGANDENVINALREAEGSIRKLELASRQDSQLHVGDDKRSTAAQDGYNAYHGEEEEYNNNRINKYEDSFTSECTEELLLLSNYQRRFRSHSETEATIFDHRRMLMGQQQQQRRMYTGHNNNPFLSSDLLQQHQYEARKCYNNGGSSGPATPAKTGMLIRSNGMMIKQQQEQQEQLELRRNSYNPGEPYNPTMLSKTVSETYLGQFMAATLPRSSSILQLLEQHQNGPPSPTLLPPSDYNQSTAWAAVGTRRERNGNASSCMKSGGGGGGGVASWSKHNLADNVDASARVNVFASSCTSGSGNGSGSFKRTLSSESVSSQSSVLIADLESSSALAGASGGHLSSAASGGTGPSVTGYLCVGLQYDKNNANEEGAELIVTVLEAKELLGPTDTHSTSGHTADAMDTFVRIYLVPDEERAMQTKLFKNSSCPSYNETFSFWVSRKHHRHSLWFHLYHSGLNQHTLIGEGELQIGDAKRPLTTWIALSDSRQTNSTALSYGELMFSLSYLPTAERLTVVVVKGRNLQFERDGIKEEMEETTEIGKDKRNSISSLQFTESASEGGGESSSTSSSSLSEMAGESQQRQSRKRNSCTAVDSVANVIVKVYLLKDGKKVSKKKTTIKRMETSPIYNESMIFSVPPYMLGSIQIRLTVAQIGGFAATEPSLMPRMQILPIGHVIVGNETTGKGLKHWNQMMTSLRKPVAMWHPLRRCLKEGGAATEENKK